MLEPQSVDINQDLSYVEQPVAIINRGVRKLCSRWISSVKVVWQYHKDYEATWELKEMLRVRYPQLFNEEGKLLSQ